MAKYKKGKSGNPGGRPKGSTAEFSIYKLEEAVRKVEKEEKIKIFDHFIHRALMNDKVLVALMKKLVPDREEKELGDSFKDFLDGVIKKAAEVKD